MVHTQDRSSKQTREFIRNATTDELTEIVKVLEQIQQNRKNGINDIKLTKQISDRVIIMRVGDIKRELKNRNGAAINGN